MSFPHRNRFDLEALEPRVLLSADPLLGELRAGVDWLKEPDIAVAVAEEGPERQGQPAEADGDGLFAVADEALPAAVGGAEEPATDSGAADPAEAQSCGCGKGVVTTNLAATATDAADDHTVHLVQGLRAAQGPPAEVFARQTAGRFNPAWRGPAEAGPHVETWQQQTFSLEPSEGVPQDFNDPGAGDLAAVNWTSFSGSNLGLRNGLETLGAWGTALGQLQLVTLSDGQKQAQRQPLTELLPFTSQTFGDLLNLEAVFKTYLAQPMITHLAANQSAGTAAFVDFMATALTTAVSGGGATLSLVIDAAGVAGGHYSVTEGTVINELYFVLPFSYTRVSQAPVDLGIYAGMRGFEIDASATVSYVATLEGTLVFGYDLRAGLAANDRFFVRLDGFEARAWADTTGLNAALNVGILGASVVNGSVNAEAGLSFGFAAAAANDRGRVTRAQLIANSGKFDGFMTLTPDLAIYANLNASLPVAASYPGLTIGTNPTLSISGANLFQQRPEVSVSGFGGLIDFTTLSAGSLEDVLQGMVAVFERLADVPSLQADLPFANDLPLAAVLDMADTFQARLVDLLRNADNLLNYRNLQEFIGFAANALGLPESAIGGLYNSATKELSFSFAFSRDYLFTNQDFWFAYDLSPLEVLLSGGTFTLSGSASVSFDVVVGMAQPVATVTGDAALPSNGQLAETALLEIFLSGGALSAGAAVVLEIAPDPTNSSAADLVADINTAIAASQLAGLVQARLEDGRLVLETTFTGPSPSLIVDESAALGFSGAAFDAPQTTAVARVSNLQANASAQLSATNLAASARIGFVGIFATAGSANFNFNFGIDFTPGGAVAIQDLFLQLAAYLAALNSNSPGLDPDNPPYAPAISFSATGAATLQGIAVDGGFIANPGPGASITITFGAAAQFPLKPDLAGQFDVAFNGNFADILKFREVDFGDITQLLDAAIDILTALAGDDFLQRDIPFTGKSFNELLGVADALVTFVDELKDAGPVTVQRFAALLKDSLQTESLVAFGADKVLRIDFTFLAAVVAAERFQLDPGGAIPGLSKIVDLQASGLLEVELRALARFAFGIDLADPLAPALLLFDATEAAFEIRLDAQNIQFAAAAPLGFFIHGGTARISDGTPQNGPARATLAFAPSGTDRLPIGSVGLSHFDFAVVGTAEAVLPVRFPINTPANQLAQPITFTFNFATQQAQFSGPDFADLFANLNLFDSLGDGLELLFLAIEQLATGQIFGFSIPFIGDQLAAVATFILDLRDAISSALGNVETQTAGAVRDLLFQAVGPAGLNFLLPRSGSGLPTSPQLVSASDVRVDLTTSDGMVDTVEIEMRLGQLTQLLGLDLGFDIGLPGLGLDFDANLILELAWEWRLIFGVDRSDGFYIVTSANDDLLMALSARLPNAVLTGQFGFLGLTAQQRPGGAPSRLDLEAGININPGGGRTTLGQLLSGGFSSFDVRLNGAAVMDLTLTLGFATLSGQRVDALPSFLVDFFFEWEFVDASTSAGLLGGKPTARFDNIRLDVGTFFADFLRPIVETIRAYLKPLDPVIDVLTTDLPFLSWGPLEDIFDVNNDGKVTVLDLAAKFGYVSETAIDFVEAAAMIRNIVNTLNTGSGLPGRGSGMTVSLGSFDFGAVDLRAADKDTVDPFAGGLFSDPAQSVDAAFAALGGNAASIFSQTQKKDSSGEGAFTFDLFDPQNLIRLIMGQPITFFTYRMPEISFDFGFSFSVPVWSPPTISVRFGASVGFRANLTFGYDSTGVERFLQEDGEPGDLFGGFYIAVGQQVPPQLTLYGEIYGGASVSFFLVSASVDIGVGLEANFRLIDPGDGRLYFWQIASLVESRGLFDAIFCLFEIDGEVYGFARVSVEVFLVEIFSFEIARITFFKFDASSQDDCFKELIPDRLERYESGARNNDTIGFAADIGVAPGIHLRGASISSPGDVDFYRFELLKPDDLDIILNGHKDFEITLYNGDGLLLANVPAGTNRKKIETGVLPAGVYLVNIAAKGGSVYAPYELDIKPGGSSTTRVLYVNTPSPSFGVPHKFYAVAIGNDGYADAGLSPDRPAATLQHVFNTYTLTANDLIVVDTGTYNDGLSLDASFADFALAGAPTERFKNLPGSTIFGSELSDAASTVVASVDGATNLTLAKFIIKGGDRGLLLNGAHGFRGVELQFLSNGTHVEAGSSDNVILDRIQVSGSTTSSGTGVRVMDSAGFQLAKSRFSLIDRGVVLENTTGALLEELYMERVNRPVRAAGGSGLALNASTFEAAITTTAPITGAIQYVGAGLEGVAVSTHTGLRLQDVEIRRYATAVTLTGSGDSEITALRTIASSTGLRGWSLDGLTVTSSQIRSGGTAFLAVDISGGGTRSSNITFSGNAIGSMPPPGMGDPVFGANARIADVDGLGFLSNTVNGVLLVAAATDVVLETNAVDGGGLHVWDSGTVAVRDNTVTSAVVTMPVNLTPAQARGIELRRVTGGVIDGNSVTGAGTGIAVVSSAGVEVFDNAVFDIATGLRVLGASGSPAVNVLVRDNTFTAGQKGVFIENGFVSGVVVRDNSLTSYTVDGIHAVGYAQLIANAVSSSNVGVRFDPATPGMWENVITFNTTGITGTGFLGNDDRSADRHNLVFLNQTGILAQGTGSQVIAFNRVFLNGTGIHVPNTASNTLIRHNLVYRNTDHGIRVQGASQTAIHNNTVYGQQGNGIRLDSGAANTGIRNNIVWQTAGTVLSVEFLSDVGFSSDYNNYFASGSAVLVDWVKAFADLLDWQIELQQDLNSIGTTRIDPLRDQPAFLDLAGNDYRIAPLTGTTINSGDPSFSFANEPGPGGGPNGLRINQGAYGDTALAAQSPASYVRVLSPNYHVDYVREQSRRIVWEFFNLAGNVTLEVHRVGQGKVADIAVTAIDNVPAQVFDQPASHGSTFWSPQMSGIAGDDAHRYYIRVVPAAAPALHAQNREPFGVPVTSNQFYVNDASQAGDVYTSAAGDNRHTGKTPSTPKAVVYALLLNYELSAEQTVYVDAGSYLHLRNVVISSADEFGRNQAFTLTGPSPGAVTFTRGDTRAASTGILIDDSSFVTLRNLNITGSGKGIEIRNGSELVALEHISLSGQSGIQVHIHSGAERASLTNVTATGGGSDGIVIATRLQWIRDSVVQGNTGMGIRLTNTGNGFVESTLVADNSGGGLFVNNGTASTTTTVGNTDLSLNRGNVFRDNGGRQLEIQGNARAAGNTVHHTPGGARDQTGTGIYLHSTLARHNVVFGHSEGIFSVGAATIEGNRVYNNATTGVRLTINLVNTVVENVIYSNPIGIHSSSGSSRHVIRNNLVYDAATAAVRVANNQSGILFENNTLHQGSGNGLVLVSSPGSTLRNNIFSIHSGIGIVLDVASQANLASNYNLFHMTGSGRLGTWAGADRAAFIDWRNASFLDRNSLTADPLFVSPAGADGQTGFVSFNGDGRDDNFHLQSQAGSFHNSALAPVRNLAGDRPVWLAPVLVADPGQSPGIDRGDAASSFAREPQTNGNFINLGAYGNTPLASLSPEFYVLVKSPGGGETWPIGQTFEIRWRSHDFTGTVNILLRQDGNPVPVETITTASENDGSFNWTLTSALDPAAGYRIEVARTDALAAGQSLATFTISEPISFYYVNDDTVVSGGYATAPGDNANDGLSPATPKASIRAILEAYTLGPGDVILVDAGTYNLTTNIIITGDDSGVTIRGFNDPSRPELLSVLDRGGYTANFHVFDLSGASNVTFEHLTLQNANRGINAASGQASNITVRDSRFVLNEEAGIRFDGNNPNLVVQGTLFQGSGVNNFNSGRQFNAIYYNSSSATITGNTFVGNTERAIYLFGNQGVSFLVQDNVISGSRTGIESAVPNALIRGNTVTGAANYGIWVQGTNSVARENHVHGNGTGIYVGTGALVTENHLVYSNSFGMAFSAAGTIRNNTIFGNGVGISANTVSGARHIENNLVYGNTGVGIRFLSNTHVTGNVVHSNGQGLYANAGMGSTNFTGSVKNNLVYGNTDYALRINWTSGSPQFHNNTLVQAGADKTAVLVDNNAVTVDFRNNIVVTGGAALNVDASSQPGFRSDHNLFHFTSGPVSFRWGEFAFGSHADWYYNTGADKRSVFADPLFVDPASGNYRLQAASPAVDAGDPETAYLFEPLSNGGRVDLGAYGNTPLAAASPPQAVQVINPSALDKVLQNGATIIDFLTSGFLQGQSAAWFNAGIATVGQWAATGTPSGVNRTTVGGTTSLANLSDPAPAAVYGEILFSAFGVGQNLNLSLAAPAGEYVVRLHFAAPNGWQSYRFDVRLNGELVIADYSPGAAAGGAQIAIAEEAPVTVGSNGLIQITLTTTNSAYAHIAGVELLRVVPGGSPDPRFDVEASLDNGATWLPVADDVPVNRRGMGSVLWIPGSPTEGRTALVRVTAASAPSVQGQSAPFLVANDGNQYYVNDLSQDSDVRTTAPGNNLNSGKSPSSPMASLEALLTAYSPGPGDVIHVDTGTYVLTRNIVLPAAVSGITIVGAFNPADPAAVTVLDRANRNTGRFVFEFTGAAGVTLQHLTLRNAYRGIEAAASGAANNLTVRHVHFHLNENAGLFMANGNNGLLVESSLFQGSGLPSGNTGYQFQALQYDGASAVIRGNTFAGNYQYGIYLNGNTAANILIENNSVSGSRYGILSRPNGALIEGNTVTGAAVSGIYVQGTQSVARLNTVNGNTVGIDIYQALAEHNLVFGNTTGIAFSWQGTARANTVYNNTGVGISASVAVNTLTVGNLVYGNGGDGIRFWNGAVVTGNTVHNNAGGLFANSGAGSTSFFGTVSNNIVHDNTNYALRIWTTTGAPRVHNNTLIQSGGAAAAVILENSAMNVDFRNNIVVVDAGRLMRVEPNSQAGFTADYNLYHLAGGASAFQWGSFQFTNQADWYYNVGADNHSLFTDPLFADFAGRDFRLAPDSPAIDAGDPDSAYVYEPLPSGGRIDMGAYGNTPLATPSVPQRIQVIDPSALSKLLQNSPAAIDFVAAGFLDQQAVAWFNAGNATVGKWTATGTPAGVNRTTVSGTINLANLSGPAPAAVYGEILYSNFGIGQNLAFTLAAPAGEYAVRLHFAAPNGWQSYRFDIRLNGQLVIADYSPGAAAGGAQIAVAAEAPVTVGANGLVQITLTTTNSAYAHIAGVELLRVDPAGAADPRFIVEASYNNGLTFVPVASGVAVDNRGRGSVQWTPTVATAGRDALVRVRPEAPVAVVGVSQPFLVANDGNRYYVNNGSLDNDVYTTAVGDNLNTGKDPWSPMASLEALLTAYSPSAGDIIYVDSGTYTLTRNIVLTAAESGITIIGAHDPDNPAAQTVLNRFNSNSPSFTFELLGVQDLLIEHLRITGGFRGISAPAGAGSGNVTLRNLVIDFNRDAGLFVGAGNGLFIVEDSRFQGAGVNNQPGSQDTGLSFAGSRLEVRRSTFIGNYWYGLHTPSGGVAQGIRIEDSRFEGSLQAGANLSVNNSQVLRSVFANSTGSNSNGLYLLGAQSWVRDSVAFGHNGSNANAIYLTNNALAENNTTYDSRVGIHLNGSRAIGNVSFSNTRGILSYGQSRIEGNRVYGNSVYGIAGELWAEIVGNQVYNNDIGIWGFPFGAWGFRGLIASNLVYANTSIGIYLQDGRENPRVVNNTVYQLTGDALRLRGTQTATILNNILRVDAGFAVNADAASMAAGVHIDFNLFFLSADPNARVGEVSEVFAGTLAEWRTLSGKDANSLFGDPLFFDMDGADDVLGYREISGIFIDGGEDDNFHLLKFSPAIDRGSTWWAPFTDLEGDPRADDPGVVDAGGGRYQTTVLGESLFDAARGTAQGWTNTSSLRTVSLPFAFSFYGTEFTQLQIDPAGRVGFPTLNFATTSNTTSELLLRRSIAPFWGRVDLSGAGRDIFIDTSVDGEVYIRWEGRNQSNNTTLRFALLLRADGAIRFDYGPGNMDGITPTIGHSLGNSFNHELIAGYDAAAGLQEAPSVRIGHVPGIVDIGAYEFKGDSLDAVPPVTLGTLPAQIESQGTVFAFLDEFAVLFSEPVDSIDARSPGSYQLVRDSNFDGLFTGADTIVPLLPFYDPATNSVRLAVEGGVLPDGLYRFTIKAANLRDVSGNRIDGDGSGAAGGDYVRVFTVIQPVLPEFTSEAEAAAVRGIMFAFQVTATENPTTFAAAGLPAGLAIDPATGLISGVPTEAGVFAVTLYATNTDGTSQGTLELTVRAAPQIGAVVINGGEDQRSMLREVEFFFDGDVSAGLTAADFRLFNRSTNTFVDPADIQLSWSFQSQSATLSFPALPGGSLPDGQYLLTIADGVISGPVGLALDADGDGAPGGALALEFHRLFGDSTGNGVVDTLDGLRFREAYGMAAGDVAFRAEFDADGDGLIDDDDRALFMANLRTGFAPEPAEPQATEVRVNDGAGQRSMVTSVEVFLTHDIGAAAAAELRLFNRTTGLWVAPEALSVSWDFASRSATITFPGLAGGSISDGVYALVLGDSVLSLTAFHRLFGDSTGNGTVDTLDGLRFRDAYGAGASDANYAAWFDVDASGQIGIADRNAFLANLRRSLDFDTLAPVPDGPEE